MLKFFLYLYSKMTTLNKVCAVQAEGVQLWAEGVQVRAEGGSTGWVIPEVQAEGVQYRLRETSLFCIH